MCFRIFCVAVCAAASLFSSCASSNKYYPVHSKAPRISSLGFYISPPPGNDWYEKHLEDSLYYFKNTEGRDYALTTKATELIFQGGEDIEDEILEYIHRSRSIGMDNPDVHNSHFSYSVENISDSLCIRYQHSYDDYGYEKKGGHPFVRIFSKGLVCRHPHSPRVGIDINYMEKFLPEIVPESFRDEGELFLSSLNFFQTRR